MVRSDAYPHVYLSSHLDDAVLSCGGRIWQQSQAGASVVVVTVFAGIPDPDSLSAYARELHERWGSAGDAVEARKDEDREALALLGADCVHWPYLDCVYRTTPEGEWAYASEESLWRRMHPSEADLIAELIGRMSGIPLAPGGSVCTPLAAGRHVDHRIVRRAAEGCGQDLTYYEDFPYASDAERVKAALAEGRWEAELVSLSGEGLEAKAAAIASYRSQLSTFWRDRQDMVEAVRTSARRVGGGEPAERYWRPISP